MHALRLCAIKASRRDSVMWPHAAQMLRFATTYSLRLSAMTADIRAANMKPVVLTLSTDHAVVNTLCTKCTRFRARMTHQWLSYCITPGRCGPETHCHRLFLGHCPACCRTDVADTLVVYIGRPMSPPGRPFGPRDPEYLSNTCPGGGQHSNQSLSEGSGTFTGP